jgi:hypothetical protein
VVNKVMGAEGYELVQAPELARRMRNVAGVPRGFPSQAEASSGGAPG